MSTKLSFKEALERQEQGQTASHPRSAFPAIKVHLRRTDPISRPVDLARLLTSFGLSLRKAHQAVDRLAEGEIVALELACPDFDQSVNQLAKLGIDARRVSVPVVDPRRIRENFGLTQTEFADRFLLNLDTIQNWEQGRNDPDPSARLLLKIIEKLPQVVEAILSEDAVLPKSNYLNSLRAATFPTHRAALASISTKLDTRFETYPYSWVVFMRHNGGVTTRDG
jgi:DNA-binding transcriptional regulator YiaG